MESSSFIKDLETFRADRLAPMVAAGRTSLDGGSSLDAKKMLQIALSNEISVSELAAAWMPSTPEIDVKIAFARQAGDEAGHFLLVAGRLAALGFDIATFRAPGENPLFQYLRGLTTTVERVAAGLFTLEAVALGVNENFMAYAERLGDRETVRIYRDAIQPDERAHREMGTALLAKYATTPELEGTARAAVEAVLRIATSARGAAAERLGTACFPGC